MNKSTRKMPISEDIQQAQSIIQAGGVIAYPTEAVYGIGCDPCHRQAVERIITLKGRQDDKRFILIASSVDQLTGFCDVNQPDFIERVGDSWPGPTTWIFPANDDCPQWLRSDDMTIAVRVSNHQLVIALCEQCDSALVSTSANISGQAPARNADEVQQVFGDAIDYIVQGETAGLHRPTRICDVTNGQVIRK